MKLNVRCLLVWLLPAIAGSAMAWVEDPPVIARSAVKVERLVASVGAPLAIQWVQLGGAGWKDVHVARIVVREGAGQRDLTLPPDAESLEVTFEKAGFALVEIEVGPAAARGLPDAWRQVTQSVKLIVKVEGRAEGRDDGNDGLPNGPKTPICAKVGSRIELVPLMDPTRLSVGSDLPVRAYLDGGKAAGATISAVTSDGNVQRATTDGSGTTHFRIDQAGRWRIIFAAESEGASRTAELLFDLPGSRHGKAEDSTGDSITLPQESTVPVGPAKREGN